MDDFEITDEFTLRETIRDLLDEGLYHQEELFNYLYPKYRGHYSVLREVINEEKNHA